jgi:HK97 family phage prohead protease
MTTPPIDNLVRAWIDPEATVVRAKDDGDGSKMVGHFAVFNSWTRISSAYEGTFLERIAPGAVADTFDTRANQIRVLYDHGADPQIGNKPLGTPTVLREDSKGAYYEVDLFDSSYVNDLKPAIRAGQLGASFRFKVTSESWETPTEARSDNPDRLEERTITGAELYEFGPVTFPAYADASAGLRSRTDEFLEHFLCDPKFVARFTERAGLKATEHILATLPPTAQVEENTIPALEERADDTPTESADGDEDDTTQRRKAYFERSVAGFAAHLSRL